MAKFGSTQLNPRREIVQSETEKSLERVLASYQNAVRAKDVGAFISLYDPKVRVFDAWGVWSYEGGEPGRWQSKAGSLRWAPKVSM